MGKIADEVQLVEDNNDSKMAGGMLTYKPAAIEGLGFGANYIRDIIPARAGAANRGPRSMRTCPEPTSFM